MPVCIYLLICLLAPPVAARSEPLPLHLTVVGKSSDMQNAQYNFGSTRYGRKVTHVFLLRNDTRATIVLDHIQTACGCLTALLDFPPNTGLPSLQPEETIRLEVTLDTSRLPLPAGPWLLSGSEASREVRVYAKGEPVHPAALLEMTGRVTTGIAFNPSVLQLGRVEESKGISRTVEALCDRSLYQPGKTRLTAPAGSQWKVIPLSHSGSSVVTLKYRVILPPRLPIGPLEGALEMEGLASSVRAAGRSLPYSGEVTGRIYALPGMVVFGLVRGNDLKDRTRSVTLVPSAASDGRLLSGARAYGKGSEWFRASVSESGKRVKVTLRRSAPVGKLITGYVIIVFRDEERLLLPVMAEMQLRR